MGIKIKLQKCKDAKMQKWVSFLLSISLLFLIFYFVPLTADAQDTPSTIVRVAISDTEFKTFIYNEISIIAQDDYFVYDKQTRKRIAKLKSCDVLRVKLTDGSFELSVNNKIIAKNIIDSIVVDCPQGLLGIHNLKRNGKQALYHGYFEINQKNDSQFFLVNVLDLESYLKGVVPNEMPVRFGLEALKAQAIAARNYVLTPRTKSCDMFDVDDSVASQVYFGAATESELSNKAVEETKGLVALYDWDLILAQYSSTAGGYTENFENAFSDPKTHEFPSKPKPYLQGRPDILNAPPLNREEEARIFYMGYPNSYDMKSPYYRWQRDWDRKELEGILSKTLIVQSKTGFIRPEFKQGDVLGEIKELKVKHRGVSGKIIELEIITDKGTFHIYKELVIRRLLTKDGKALPSANVVFENLYDTDKKLTKIVAYGGGLGHGVGMSQFGAGFMATSLHKPFDKILKRYYTGITISTVPVILSSDPQQKTIAQKFYAPYKKATLVVDNKYQLSHLKVCINGKIVIFDLEKSIVPAHRINRIDVSNYVKIGENEVIFYYDEKDHKGIRLYIELVEKDDSNYNF